MTIKSDILKAIKDNLADLRMVASQIYLSELIERKAHPTGIDQYRISNTNATLPATEGTKSYITSLDMFISELTEDDLEIEFMHSGYKPNDNKPAPIAVSVKNFEVELHHNSEEDLKYIQVWGGSTPIKNIGFVLAYVCDNDIVLPLKIVNINLG